MKTICVANGKGGTGKTSTAVNLASGLAIEGHRVLLADLDGQANASTWLLGDEALDARGAADVIWDSELEDRNISKYVGHEAVYGRAFELDVLVGGKKIEWINDALPSGAQSLTRLGAALEAKREAYDFVVIDTGPGRNKVTGNGLCAADHLLVPFEASVFGVKGLVKLNEALAELSEVIEPLPSILGVVLFRVDAREGLATAEGRGVLAELGNGFETEIRTSTRAKRLPALRISSFGRAVKDAEGIWEPVTDELIRRAAGPWELVDPRGKEDYKALVDEVLKKMKVRAAA